MWTWFHKWGSPKWFYDMSKPWSFWLGLLSIITLSVGVVWGLAFAPSDYQMGNSYRIIFVHVPAAFSAQSIYMGMAVLGIIGFVWKMKMSFMMAKVLAPIGCSLAILAFITGAIWGAPTWGTPWVWDARIISVLVMVLLYFGVIAIHYVIDNQTNADKAAAVLTILGTINIPIIKYSVEWWNTLHQPSSIKLTEKPAMPPEMFIPLFIMIFGFYFFIGYLSLVRGRAELLERERRAGWVKDEIKAQAEKY